MCARYNMAMVKMVGKYEVTGNTTEDGTWVGTVYEDSPAYADIVEEAKGLGYHVVHVPGVLSYLFEMSDDDPEAVWWIPAGDGESPVSVWLGDDPIEAYEDCDYRTLVRIVSRTMRSRGFVREKRDAEEQARELDISGVMSVTPRGIAQSILACME